jgi:hypothetical protein
MNWLFVALIIAMLPMWVSGTLTFIYWIKPADDDKTDASNVINRIRLWWFALTRPHLFVDVFPWLRHDELDNLNKGEKSCTTK